MGRAKISSQSRTNRPLGSPDPRVSPTPIQAYKPTMATPPSVFPSSFTMVLARFFLLCLVCHIVTGINFPGLRVPLSGPRSSIYSLESCTDVSSTGVISNLFESGHPVFCSGATSTTPVVLAAGEGRQFTSPGYDGSTGYGTQAKCLWTFTPATGATLTFSCSAFDLTATSAVGDKCTGLAIL